MWVMKMSSRYKFNEEEVAAIIEAVIKEGDQALLEFTQKYDNNPAKRTHKHIFHRNS